VKDIHITKDQGKCSQNHEIPPRTHQEQLSREDSTDKGEWEEPPYVAAGV
jgi:hypothetical protein